MARSSYPQQGLFPGDGPDCGPYTANEWRAWILTAMRAGGMVNTGAAAPPGLPATPLYPSVGVFYVCPDRLLVEENPANTIRIGTGAWLCDGTFGYNDTQITGIVPAVGVRTDYVIVRQNYSGADFNTGPAGAALTVTDNTADVTIIDSANFTQDQDRATYWDIPLASYDIDGAGVITNLVDLREWVDAETKQIYADFVSGRDITAPADRLHTFQGVPLVTNNDTSAYLTFRVPHNFISGMTVQPMIITDPGVANNNGQFDLRVHYGTCDEARDAHTDELANVVIAITGAEIRRCYSTLLLSLGNAALGDVMNVAFDRDGHLDAYTGTIWAVGLIIEYLGWGRR